MGVLEKKRKVVVAWMVVMVASGIVQEEIEAEGPRCGDSRTQKQSEAGLSSEEAEDLKARLKRLESELKTQKSASKYGYVGNAQFRLGRFEDAEKSFSRASELAPSEPRYLSNLGALHVALGRYEKALEYFGKAKVLDDTDGTLAKNYDSAETMWRAEKMVSAIRDPEETYYDVNGVLTGTNYSEKAEIAFSLVMKRPELHDRGIEVLRLARKASPKFAVNAHLLANVLVDKHLHVNNKIKRGDPQPLLDEATSILTHSLSLDDVTLSPSRDDGSEKKDDDVFSLISEPAAKARVVTVASSFRPELERLGQSAERVGLGLDVLGLNEPWRGLGSKITLLREYLVEKTKPTDLVLFVDAYDVLLLPNCANLTRLFWDRVESTKPGVVLFGAELNPAPDPALRLLYPPTSSPFKFLNSGTILGRSASLLKLVDAVHADIQKHHVAYGADPYRFDDQRWYARFLLANPRKARLDASALFFQTLHGLQASDFHVLPSASLHSSISNSYPLLIHGNGDGIDTFHALSRQLLSLGWPSSSPFLSSVSPLLASPPFSSAAS